MNHRVVILVADDAYINQVKSLAVNCRDQGKFDGDFAIISPHGSKAIDEFRKHHLSINETGFRGFLQKFEVFGDFFKQWDEALYLDCDVIVQRPLDDLFALLKDHPFWMDTEDGDTMRTFLRDPTPEQHGEIYNWIRAECPWATLQTFNSAFMLFKPKEIPSGTVGRLEAMQVRIHPVNRPEDGGTDQQIINLVLHERIKKIPNKLVCWWGLDEPENRGPSPGRGYVGGEIPVALHYGRWYAPWKEKRVQDAAYRNDRIGMVCREFYKQNVNRFAVTFPQ